MKLLRFNTFEAENLGPWPANLKINTAIKE